MNYKCLRCGHILPEKKAHWCNGSYIQRGLKWEEIIDNQTIDYMNKWANIAASSTLTDSLNIASVGLLSTEGMFRVPFPILPKAAESIEKTIREAREDNTISEETLKELFDLHKPKKKWHFAKGIIPWRKSDDIGVKKENTIMWGIHIKNNPDEHKKENTINNLKYKTMRKEDLKTGMRVEYKNGETRFVYITDTESYFTDCRGVHMDMSEYKDDLTCWSSGFNIHKVYAIPKQASEFINVNVTGKLLWNREDEKTFVIKGVEYSESTLISLIKKATE